MSKINAYRKAIVAIAGVVVAFGIIDSETASAVASAIAALLVLLIPNAE